MLKNEILYECVRGGQFRVGERVTGITSWIAFRFGDTVINGDGEVSHQVYDTPTMEGI